MTGRKWEEGAREGGPEAGETGVPGDLELLLRATWPLLQSHNSGVIVAVADLHLDLGPGWAHPRIARALTFAVRTSRQSCHFVLLDAIASMVQRAPALFAGHIGAFFIKSVDPTPIRTIKLKILAQLATADNVDRVLVELQAYIRTGEPAFVASVIETIGEATAAVPKIRKRALATLQILAGHPSPAVATRAVGVIVATVAPKPWDNYKVVRKLLQRYEALEPAAKADVLWVALSHLPGRGEAAAAADEPAEGAAGLGAAVEKLDLDEGAGPAGDAPAGDAPGRRKRKTPLKERLAILDDLGFAALRQAAQSFAAQAPQVKLEVLNGSMKLFLHHRGQQREAGDQVALLHGNLLDLARVDPSIDVRDRCRTLGHLT